jgi:uncharacterized repeat protein (TIGR01451 family)
MKLKRALIQIGLAANVAAFLAGCASPPPDITHRQDQNITSVDQTQAGYDTLGRRWGGEPAAPAQPATPEQAPLKTTCNEATPGLIKMTKMMPPEISLGGEFIAQLHLTAQACVGNVVVHDTVPANSSFVRSEPAAIVDGSQLTWQVGNLDSGESRDIKVWLKAQQEGTIMNCASVAAEPRTCAITHVVHPAIELTKTAPAELLICDPVPVTLTVKNTGSSRLTGVTVTDTLPDGLSSDGKNSLSFDVGNLGPGDSKDFRFNAVAARIGSFVNNAQANSAQGVNATASSTTVVHAPVLTVACAAPDTRYMGRPFEVSFTVNNTGDAPAAGTVLELPIPNGLKATGASNGGQIGAGKITWDLGSVAVNSAQKLTASFTGEAAGSFAFNPTARGTCAKEVTSSCQTVLKGVAAILLEKSDDPDPIGVGEQTTYTVRVTNQGFADDNNVHVVVTIAPELVPVSATGDGVISGQTVTFPVVPRLPAKEAVTYRIVAKGVKTGDGRTRFELNSEMLQSPVVAEESTHVY